MPNSTTRTNVRLSAGGVFGVHSYSPKEGESGTPLSAIMECLVPQNAVHNPLYFRLIIGKKAVCTHVELVPQSARFLVKAEVPPLMMHGSISTTVGLVAQVIDGQGQIIDSAFFGHFIYWEQGVVANFRSPFATKEHPTVLCTPSPPEMSRVSTSSTLVSTDSLSCTTVISKTNSDSFQVSKTGDRMFKRRKLEKIASICDDDSVPTLRRLANSIPPQPFPFEIPPNSASETDIPTLDIVSQIDTLWLGWSEEEICSGRRLVKFTQIRSANQMLISCEAVTQDEYEEGTIVISCIRRVGAGTFHVTSVDMLYLVENIVGEPLTTDEKNRLRRNVECFKPMTVSKANVNTRGFFHQLMSFPPPQPRNIEKDLKVFDWKHLKLALLKVLSKYSLGGPNMKSITVHPEDIFNLATNQSTIPETCRLEQSSIPEATPDKHPAISPICETYGQENKLSACASPSPIVNQIENMARCSPIASVHDQHDQFRFQMPGSEQSLQDMSFSCLLPLAA